MILIENANWLNLKGLKYQNMILYFNNVNTIELAKKFGTPIYIISEQIIREKYRTLKNILNSEYKKNQIHYAVKANSNISILKILNTEGAFFDCTSQGEIHACFKAGIAPERIIYTGNMFTDDDFEFSVKNDIIINLDSISQLERLTKIYEKLGKEKKIISFRINPEFGAGHHAHDITAGREVKFGILEHQVKEAYKKSKDKGFERFGIHQHIGSGINNPYNFEKAIEKYLSIIKNLASSLKINFEFIDFGGGLGIPYRPNEKPLDLELYKEIVVKPFKKLINIENLGEPVFKIEPGRFLVAESCILITQINTIKDNGYKLFAGVDAGFNTLIRPTMYGSYHHIMKCNKNEKDEVLKYDIVGPICESGDILGKERELPNLIEGDYLAILDTGAYGYVMSSNYNSRPRSAEILISDGHIFKIREEETFDDLLKNQIVPDHLK
ncbi:MAG: diaminopimelate decarboxylase [Candidatus Hodarchaeota archaeon]